MHVCKQGKQTNLEVANTKFADLLFLLCLEMYRAFLFGLLAVSVSAPAHHRRAFEVGGRGRVREGVRVTGLGAVVDLDYRAIWRWCAVTEVVRIERREKESVCMCD